jgi:hypothetical protein
MSQGIPNIILPGEKFGKLTIVEYHGTDKRRNKMFLCMCVCGNTPIVPGTHLKSGATSACKKCGNITHGESKKGSKEYKAWCHIRDRCSNPNNKSYPDYGGKGIRVCERWTNSFEAFLEDVGRAPSPKHTIDRFPNNKGNYEPGNVRWADWFQQQGNRTNNRWITALGKTMILQDWSRELNICQRRLWYHLNNGKTIEYIYEQLKSGSCRFPRTKIS